MPWYSAVCVTVYAPLQFPRALGLFFVCVPLARVYMLQVDPIRQRLQEAALAAAEGRLLLLVRSPYCIRG